MIDQLLTEKLRPKKIEHMILPHRIRSLFQNKIINQHVLLAGSTGCGKTTLAKILSNDLPHLFINVSDESSVETLRSKVNDFCATVSILDGKSSRKVVILDECLSDDEYVRIGTLEKWESIRLSDLEWDKEYPCISMNIETLKLEDDICKLISERESELYEVILEDGRIVHVTSNHPFMICDDTGNAVEKTIDNGLSSMDSVLCFIATKMELIKVKSIKKINNGNVRNLRVSRNHTFLTSNGICTHNCDGASDQFYKALRGTMEKFEKTTRFIGTCNYLNKVPEPVQSRFEVINFDPINSEEEELIKNDWAARVNLILGKVGINIDSDSMDEFVKEYFPDMRSALNKIQAWVIEGIKDIDISRVLDSGWSYEDIYKMIFGPKNPILNYQTIVGQYSSKVDDVMSALGEEFINWIIKNKPDHAKIIPAVTVLVAEHQAQRQILIDPVVSLLALIFNIQKLI